MLYCIACAGRITTSARQLIQVQNEIEREEFNVLLPLKLCIYYHL
jgi:hypothetical protein